MEVRSSGARTSGRDASAVALPRDCDRRIDRLLGLIAVIGALTALLLRLLLG